MRLLVAAALALAACVEDPDGLTPSYANDPVLCDRTAVEPLGFDDGATIQLVRTPSGGYVIPVSIRAFVNDPHEVKVRIQINVFDDGTLVVDADWRVRLDPDDGWFVRREIPAVVDPIFWFGLDPIVDHWVDVWVSVADADGCAAAAHRVVFLTRP